MLAGDLVAAERELRGAYELLTKVGEKYFLSTIAGLLAQTLYALERFDEAELLGRLTKELATEDDISTQALWRCVLGKMLARRGSVDEAEAYVRDALAILAPTDHTLLKYGTLLDLAEVQRLAGSDTRATLDEARALALGKGSSVMVAVVDDLLVALAAEPITS